MTYLVDEDLFDNLKKALNTHLRLAGHPESMLEEMTEYFGAIREAAEELVDSDPDVHSTNNCGSPNCNGDNCCYEYAE